MTDSEHQALRRLLAQRYRREAAARLRGQALPAEHARQTRALAAAHRYVAQFLSPAPSPGGAAESLALLRTAELLDRLGLLPALPEPLQRRQQARARVLARLLRARA
ncbi:hypothetical protein [Hymenobacter latericus]|uniref:hypothetical protein n=1 Tax=Hymenobacter sp. YIM 151858-1 TaxID=2987688 RepID=UPI0022275F74|nr:hypothetical protein [Hymenobacter sp. YIM 151858-1]UYZ61215.1 hypothetical protein OIS50_19795 [Hymenobacter sp. YIM 151858-1]